MRLSVLLAALFILSACGSGSETLAPDTAIDADADVEAEAEVVESFEPITPPAQAAEPAGSAGTFRLHYIRGGGDSRDTTIIEGFLPPPMPTDAMASIDLDAVSKYHVLVQLSTVTADVDLRRNGFVYLTKDEVDEIAGDVRWADSDFAIKGRGLFRGTGYAFTFSPLWEATGASPRLEVRDEEDESVLGELALPVADAPVWAQPVTLPTSPTGTRITFSADLVLSDPSLVPVFIFPNTFGNVGWGADVLEVDSFEARMYEREGRPDRPYEFWTAFYDADRGDAFLVLARL